MFEDFERLHTGEFDTRKLIEMSLEAIAAFSEKHQNETFYGFCIDASFLCLNSNEALENTAKNYFSRFGGQTLDHYREELRWSIGDWEYQGFFDLAKHSAFDDPSYIDHYHFVMDLECQEAERTGFQEQDPLFVPDVANTTSYGKAMNEILDGIRASGCLNALTRTQDFKVFRVEHSY